MAYAFLDLASQYQFQVVNQFQENTNCEIAYINCASTNHIHGDLSNSLESLEYIKKRNPRLVLIEQTEFLFVDVFLEKHLNTSWILTTSDIKKCKHIESMAMRLMDRSSLLNMSSFLRKRYYLFLLNYFKSILESNSITDVVTFDTPHSFYSHIFYELAKIKGLNFITLEYHYLPEFSVMFNQPDYPKIPYDYKVGANLSELKANLPVEIKKNIFRESAFLNLYKSKETKAIIKKNRFTKAKLYFRFLEKVLKNTVMGIFPFLFKNEVLHFSSLNNLSNRFVYRQLLNYKLIKLINYNVLYNKLANADLDYSENFILVALHMQPEKTSQPMGDEYDNQMIMINILSQSLPSGWKLFVKEHPNQFNVKKIPNVHYRDKNFYTFINKLENVSLVPLEVDSKFLIKKSKLVATLTGTIGWEAITQFTPALVFGNTYYMHCKCAGIVDSVETCKSHIAQLSLLTKEKMTEEIYRYLNYYFEMNYLVKSGRWESQMQLNDLSYSEQIKNLSNSMTYFHELNQVK